MEAGSVQEAAGVDTVLVEAEEDSVLAEAEQDLVLKEAMAEQTRKKYIQNPKTENQEDLPSLVPLKVVKVDTAVAAVTVEAEVDMVEAMAVDVVPGHVVETEVVLVTAVVPVDTVEVLPVDTVEVVPVDVARDHAEMEVEVVAAVLKFTEAILDTEAVVVEIMAADTVPTKVVEMAD